MGDQARRAILGAIRNEGPITFAEYMERALYGPGGYYERPPVGAGGDFVTSPHVHPVFAELLGAAIRELHSGLGAPAPLRLTEVGAGDGTLARRLLSSLEHLDVAYTAVEVSAGARKALAGITGVRVSASLGGHADVVVANELLDNLPFRLLRGDREVRVGVLGDRFVEVLTDPTDDVADLTGDGDVVVPVGTFAFVDRLAEVLPPAGYALLIDYGASGSTGGSLHGYREHRVVEDVLASPGETDVTVGVDVDAVRARAAERGLTAFPVVSQHDALMALGFEGWFREQLATQHAQLDARDGIAAVRTWADKSRATLLADPGGLGRFHWILLATPGLPAPAWLGGTGRSTD